MGPTVTVCVHEDRQCRVWCLFPSSLVLGRVKGSDTAFETDSFIVTSRITSHRTLSSLAWALCLHRSLLSWEPDVVSPPGGFDLTLAVRKASTYKHSGTRLYPQSCVGRDRWTPRAHWPANLANQWPLCWVRALISKIKVKSDQGRYQCPLVSGHAHVCMCTCVAQVYTPYTHQNPSGEELSLAPQLLTNCRQHWLQLQGLANFKNNWVQLAFIMGQKSLSILNW